MTIGNYVISWRHNNNGTHVKGSTDCLITGLEEGLPTHSFTGCAMKHAGDNYDKNKGRYYSFKRAVDKILDKEIRKSLWEGIKEKAPNLISKGSLKS